DYSFNWDACDGENCSAVAGLETDFLDGAEKVRSMMHALDSAKIDLFATEGSSRLIRLLALLGDKYRQSVVYPMDKKTTADSEFLKSYYADHSVYNYRRINPAQTDMGNFSRSDFSHITPGNKTVSLTSKQYFRSTGAYALPGQTVRVTRQDSSDLTVKVFVNTLRSGATHQWADNGYKRPKYLQSPHFELKSGETIQFTSPYGGPLQLEFSTNDLPVQVYFENVGEHPYWASSADDESFTQKLAAGDYDWAELVTPGFEIHSKLDKMRTSMSDSKWGNAQALAAATMRYMHNFPHVMAGFQGPGIDVVPEIHDFATNKGFTIENLDRVKHMNADQASCGYGCSGNPYDAYWSYSPIGHGDVHELGHGLQGGMRFSGWENHSMTNHYSYYTKSKYFQTTGTESTCQTLSFEQAFNTLQSSVGQSDPAVYMQENWWDGSNWNKQASMYIQMMMAAQASGALSDGWHLRARLHIIEREFNRADDSESTWLAKRDALGFGNYSLADAKAVYKNAKNDWLVIALSTATGKDFRDYLTMWGISFSTTADSQVAAMGYPAIPNSFFISSATGYCRGEGFDGTSLPVDGAQTWPLNTMSNRMHSRGFGVQWDLSRTRSQEEHHR
ncbi:MAG: ImpA family metalloprotease, partial [Thiolinea sp.]